jgi:hypothetical protein
MYNCQTQLLAAMVGDAALLGAFLSQPLQGKGTRVARTGPCNCFTRYLAACTKDYIPIPHISDNCSAKDTFASPTHLISQLRHQPAQVLHQQASPPFAQSCRLHTVPQHQQQQQQANTQLFRERIQSSSLSHIHRQHCKQHAAKPLQ